MLCVRLATETKESPSALMKRLARKILCACLCWFMPFSSACFGEESSSIKTPSQQTVELLGIGDVVNRQDLASRERAFRKILQAVMEVQSAENRLEMEIVYTYDVLGREQRRINDANQLFNIANFLQFGILYTIEPYARIDKRFNASAVLTCISAGVGLLLPTLNILYDKQAKATHLKPPSYLTNLVEGKPVDGTDLPPLAVRYLDSPPPGSVLTRRELLNQIWKKHYHVDMSKPETLCRIDDNKDKNFFLLNTRIELLWSLYTTVQGLNRDLLALLDEVSEHISSHDYSIPKLSQSLNEHDHAVILLCLQPMLAELKAASPNSDRERELRLAVLERMLHGYLGAHIAKDQCQEQLNYQYDVVLAQLMSRRGKFLQRTFEANFIQANVLGACAGGNYLHNNARAGNECFIVASGNSLAINTLSLLATQGGYRKNKRPPNSLAAFFGLIPPDAGGYSPLAWRFLNMPKPSQTSTETRREALQKIWIEKRVSSIDLNNRHNREALASMPSCKSDTINLVVNRIALLSSLRDEFHDFDSYLLSLLRDVWARPEAIPRSNIANANIANASPSTVTTAKLLKAEGLLDPRSSDVNRGLLIDRIVFEAFLETNVDADVLMREITIESQVLNRMIRQRNLAIQLTNITNFYQIDILGSISNSLGLSSHSNYVLAGNNVNIVSGYLVSCLAILALAETRGFLRPTEAEPNLIASAFDNQPHSLKLSPTSAGYLDLPSAIDAGMSRRQALLKYWRYSKVLNIDVGKEPNIEKLTAEGRGHSWWTETISLIRNRLVMLYDLRATLRTSNAKFSELLAATD